MWCFSRSQQLSRFHFIKYWSLKFYRLILYDVYPEVIQPCNMKNRHLLKKIEETLYIGQWHLSPLQSRHVGFTQFSQLPLAALLYFPESHWRSEISFLPKVILVLGKARSCRTPNLSCKRAESPGWFDVLSKTSAQDVMHEPALCDEAANHQLPTAASFWIIWIVSVEEC